jgi:hypothetical protein
MHDGLDHDGLDHDGSMVSITGTGFSLRTGRE